MEFTYEAVAVVDAPLAAIYNDWTNARSLPHVLSHIRATAQDDAEDLARLIILLDGHHIEFDAERTMCSETSICWQSLGKGFYYVLCVSFEVVDIGCTRVTANVCYDPPGFLPDIFETLGLARGLRFCLEEDMRRYATNFEMRSSLQALAV